MAAGIHCQQWPLHFKAQHSYTEPRDAPLLCGQENVFNRAFVVRCVGFRVEVSPILIFPSRELFSCKIGLFYQLGKVPATGFCKN